MMYYLSFPLNALPPKLSAAVTDAEQNFKVPLALAVGSALGTLSTVGNWKRGGISY